MGSMAAEDVTSSSSVVPKSEPIQDGYTPSSISSIDEPEASTSAEATTADPAPVIKRKGGRKPIYATSEERKQRNRQAQAAFRERRTEYIKQLETTIQHHEDTLQTLQQSHRTAADECLMLRYKNSLLERILLEKGIDVQAELRLKGSPHLRPVRHGASATGQASPMQKAMLNRQQQGRQRPVVAPPIQTVNTSSPSVFGNMSGSPAVQPTPPSQQSSPSALRSPGFRIQGGMRSPTNEIHMQQQQQQQHNQQQPRPVPQTLQNLYAAHPRTHMRNQSSSASSQQFQLPRQSSIQQMQPGYYPSSFQKHYDQLDQEYDAQADMLDDVDVEDLESDSFIPNFRLPPTNVGISMGMQASPPTTASAASDVGVGTQSIPFDYDPMLDADPFGLTASMHFPNPYTFPSSQTRR